MFVHGYVNDLRTLPASDTFRIRSNPPKQGQVNYPMTDVEVRFWMGRDPEDEASGFHSASSAAIGSGVLVSESGIEISVGAAKMQTCVRNVLYFWKVRAHVQGIDVFTLDSGVVKFSDKVI